MSNSCQFWCNGNAETLQKKFLDLLNLLKNLTLSNSFFSADRK